MSDASSDRRVAIFGWGLVAPGAGSVPALRRLLASGKTALAPTDTAGLGRGLFCVGEPDFALERYRPWVEQRFGGPRYQQLRAKLGENSHFALGAMIEALESNPGLEPLLRALDTETHVYLGTALGDLPESYAAGRSMDHAARRWHRFWAQPSRCAPLGRWLGHERDATLSPPEDPQSLPVDSLERADAHERWDRFWSDLSAERADFERRYAEIEARGVGEDLEKGPLQTIRAKQKALRALMDEARCPEPPWESVDPRHLWSLANVPAAQVTMLLGTHGPAWTPVGACATFGVSLKCGLDALRSGEARAVVVGTTDPRATDPMVAAFHRARLMAASGQVNGPFESLVGAHFSGGACVWVLGEVGFFRSRGLEPVGPQVAAAALSSDAEHLITPSLRGPRSAIERAMREAGTTPETVGTWDLHATGTPGDASELRIAEDYTNPRTALTARKGLFGHGMANAGGWELTAQALGLLEGKALGTGMDAESVHPSLRARLGERLVTGERPVQGDAVKLMLGLGGITAAVVLRRMGDTTTR